MAFEEGGPSVQSRGDGRCGSRSPPSRHWSRELEGRQPWCLDGDPRPARFQPRIDDT